MHEGLWRAVKQPGLETFPEDQIDRDAIAPLWTKIMSTLFETKIMSTLFETKVGVTWYADA